MEMPIDLFNRLSEEDLAILPPDVTLETGSDKVVLDRIEQQQVESGFVTAQYLMKLAQNGGVFKKFDFDINAMSQLKGSHNATSRLYNWNIITKQLEKMGIEIDADSKSLMVAGDADTIIDVLIKIYTMELEMGLADSTEGGKYLGPDAKERQQALDDSPSKLSIFKEAKPEQPISILDIKAEMNLDYTKSTLQFVIVSLCQALSTNPKQAAGLLTDHNYFLMHACVKGVKGDHTPIMKWYQLLYQNSKHLIDLAVESLPEPEEEQVGLNDSQIEDEDAQPLFIVLGALKCGLYSDNFTVSDMAFRVFSKISTDLNQYGYQRVFAKWLLQQPDSENGKLGGGLESTLFMLNKHSQIVESVALLLISSFTGSFELLIPEIKENHIPDNLPKLYTLLNDLLPYLHLHHREEVVDKLLIQNSLIEELLIQAESNNFADSLLKASCLSLLVEIWTLEPQLISENAEILEQCLKVFKNTCKFSSKALKMSTLGLMFKLLDQFASTRNSQAPVIYKLLTFALIENIEDEDIREFMLVSFSNVFAAHKSIPISILVEPLVRMLQMNEKKITMNTFDYTFFKILANHSKLTPSPLGIQLMDQFAKTIMNEPIWAASSLQVFMIIAERFKTDQQIQDFLLKLATLGINSVMQLKKQDPPFTTPKGNQQNKGQIFNVKNVQPSSTSGKPDKKAIMAAQASYHDIEIARRIKLASIVAVIEKVLRLNALSDERPILNEEIRALSLQTNRRHLQVHGYYSKALLHLLEFWHTFDAQKVQDDYTRDLDDYERPQPDEDEIETLKKLNNSHIHEDRGRFILEDDFEEEADLNNESREEEYFKILPSETRNSEISSRAINHINNQSQLSGNNNNQRQSSHQGSRQLVVYNTQKVVANNNVGLPPMKRVNNLAHYQIEAIKNKREEKAVKQQIEEEKKKLIQERNFKKAKDEVVKRRIQLGVIKGSNQDADQQQLVIYADSTPMIEEQNVNPKRHSMPASSKHINVTDGMRLINLDTEEEQRDSDGVKILMLKYNKVFKFLFNKYALSRAQHSKVEKFEYYGDKSINAPEICKMLRDHDLLASLVNTSIMTQVMTSHDQSSAYQKITKEQVQTLVRLLNLKNFKRQDQSGLSFPHFLELMPQLAYFFYSKTLAHLSTPDMLMKMLQHNERVMRQKGQSTILYEDPDISTIGDQEMLKEMNKRVKENSEYILPEGYYKVAEKEQVFQYALPEELPIKESQRVVIEVLDSLMVDMFGFHILEALVTYESRYKVKPRIKHSSGTAGKLPESNSALSYMKPFERKPFSRDLSAIKSTPGGAIASQSPLLQPLISLENQQNQFVRPKLGIDLKLQVMSYQNKAPLEKNHMQETAEVLEEILQAVDLGLDKLPERVKAGKDEIKNKAKEEKELKLKQDKLVEKQKEELRKKRHAMLQEELEKQKQEKIKQELELKSQKDEKEKESKIKEKRDKSLALKKVEQKRLTIEESKKVKLDDKTAKVKEEEEKKQLEKVQKQKDQKEFFRKQKEQLEQEFQKRRKDQEASEILKKDMEDLKKQQFDNIKDNMVNFMKQNKDQQRNEQAEWEGIHSFYSDKDVQELFAKYEKSIGQMFKHFAAMDKKEMSVHGMMRINYNEFNKFGFLKKVTPKVITNDDMVLIFRAVVRECSTNMLEKVKDVLGIGVNSLGLEDFKKALIRIVILGQTRLGEEDYLENRLTEIMNNPDFKVQAPQSTTNARAPKNIRIRGRSSLNSGQSQRQKQVLNKEDSSARLQTNPSPQRAADGTAEEEPPIVQPVAKRSSVAPRKTKEQKIIDDLTKAKERAEKMLNVKIEDKRLTKGFDASLVNLRSLEAFLIYLQLTPNDDKRARNAEGNEASTAEIDNPYNDNEQQQNNNYDEDGQQASQSNHGIDLDELERQPNGDYDENIVGPNGENENWKVME